MANFIPPIVYRQQTVNVGNVLYTAYRMARALKHPKQGISNSESAEGLEILNDMIDGWKIESLLMEYTRRTVQLMVSNQASYSVGPGQDFDLERPEVIHRAGFIIGPEPNTAELPMDIIPTFEQWQQYVCKDVTSSIPLALYYIPSVPNGQARFWPIPNVGSFIAIYTPQLLSEFDTVDDIVEVRKGVREMITYNLAVKVNQRYPEKQMHPTVYTQAEFYKQRVKSNQWVPMLINSDPAAMQERYAGWRGIPGFPKTWVPYS